jgi:hypothetical protein
VTGSPKTQETGVLVKGPPPSHRQAGLLDEQQSKGKITTLLSVLHRMCVCVCVPVCVSLCVCVAIRDTLAVFAENDGSPSHQCTATCPLSFFGTPTTNFP